MNVESNKHRASRSTCVLCCPGRPVLTRSSHRPLHTICDLRMSIDVASALPESEARTSDDDQQRRDQRKEEVAVRPGARPETAVGRTYPGSYRFRIVPLKLDRQAAHA